MCFLDRGHLLARRLAHHSLGLGHDDLGTPAGLEGKENGHGCALHMAVDTAAAGEARMCCMELPGCVVQGRGNGLAVEHSRPTLR